MYIYVKLKSEYSQDYAQKPQRNCTFMNLAAGEPEPAFVNLLRSPGIDSQPGGIDSSESIRGLLEHL